MRITLFLLACLSFLGGGAIMLQARSAVHEIEAFVLFLIAATLLAGAAIVEAISRSARHSIKTNDLLAQLLAGSKTTTTAAVPAAVEPRFYVRLNDETNGPFPIAQIRELRNRGTIDDDTPVAREGEKDWRKTREVIG